MRPRFGVVVRALVCASVLAIATTSLAFAKDPDEGNVAGYSGTGISSGSGPAYVPPPEVVEKKVADLQAYLRNGTVPVRGLKTGAGSRTVAALAAVSPAYASSAYLSYFPGFHQKRTYYCLVAMVQSVAYFDLEGQWYEFLGTNGTLPAQDKIYNGYTDPDGTNEPGIRATNPQDLPGSYDTLAIQWINRQFSRYQYGFIYVSVSPSSQTDFLNEIHFDVAGSYEGAYARVDLSKTRNAGYMWYQAPGAKGDIDHATMAVGYNDSAGTIRSYDPYASPSGSTCTAPSSTGYLWGCNWTISTARYFYGLDSSLQTGQNGPVWY
jgi:hypothetical protein